MIKKPPRPQSGNAAWKAARVATRFKKGRPGHRTCKVIARSTGRPCGNLAMRDLTVCFKHGGQMRKGLARMRNRKRVRHHAWTDTKRTSELR